MAKAVDKIIKYYSPPDNFLPLKAIYAKPRNISEDYKVCTKCPEKKEQPIANFSIKKRLKNGKVLPMKYCKACVNKEIRARYLKKKSENKEWHKRFLEIARNRYKTKMILIKNNPRLYENYKAKAREANNAINAKKREEKIKNGWRPKQTAIAVMAFDMEGNIVKSFTSIGAAARFYGGHISNYIDALKGRKHTARGFYWRYCNKPNLPIPKNRRKHRMRKPVSAIDKNGKVVMSFESIAEAAKRLGGCRANYSRALKNETRRAKGYYWRHFND